MLDLYGTLDKEKFGIKIIAKSQITTDDLKQQSFRLQVCSAQNIDSFFFSRLLPERE